MSGLIQERACPHNVTHKGQSALLMAAQQAGFWRAALCKILQVQHLFPTLSHVCLFRFNVLRFTLSTNSTNEVLQHNQLQVPFILPFDFESLFTVGPLVNYM